LDQQGIESSAGKNSGVVKGRTLTSRPAIDTEAKALSDLSAMPIYFASSYALVKPYVSGFDANVLDAPLLKTIRIDGNWKPPASSPGNTGTKQ
jgi:hypothetical protein